MANTDRVPVSMTAIEGLAESNPCRNLQSSISSLSTEEGDMSPPPCFCSPLHELYQDLSPRTEAQVKALTSSLHLVLHALDSDLDPVNLRECKSSVSTCSLKGVGANSLMQRRSQRICTKST